jgi:hypothetical protein
MWTKIKELWARLPLKYRKEVHSFIITFIVALLTAWIVAIESGFVPTSGEVVVAMLAATMRSALKSAWNAVLFPTMDEKTQ